MKRLLLQIFSVFVFSGYLLYSQTSSHTEQPDVEVRLKSIEFMPKQIKADPGDEITFVNQDPFEHDVYIVRTANNNIVLIPPSKIQPGESIKLKIEEKGLYTVFCTIHGGMRAKLSTTGTFELTREEKLASAAIKASLPPIAKEGENLFWGKAQCYQCHRVGERGEGERGPNLSDVGLRSRFRAKEMGLGSGTKYLIQSVIEPDAYVVAGYTNDMIRAYQPPVNLTPDEIKSVITYLQSQGGEVDTWEINIRQDLLLKNPSYNPFRSGNARRGKELFSEFGCEKCHAVGNRGGGLGPDLSSIGAFRNWAWLAESILEPNAEVGKNWTPVTIELDWGDPVAGILKTDTDSTVTVLVGKDQFEIVFKNEIDNLVTSKESNMPANFSEMLTFRQIADLINYLQTLKDENK